jgi:isopenicillin N synthase-like dioxygenase
LYHYREIRVVENNAIGRFPVVDLAIPDADAVARALDAACRDLGFCFVVGHGVAPEIIGRAYARSLAFFDLPLAEKLAVARPAEAVSRGYNRLADQSHAATFDADGSSRPDAAPDLQESFAIGRIASPILPPSIPAETAALAYAPNLWPRRAFDFEAALTDYYAAMERLSTRLMALFARALHLPSGFFDDTLDRHASILRMVHYPEQATPPRAEQWRAGPHTDFGTLTILRTDDAPGGLQVRDATGTWLDALAPPGAFVINIGDLMRRWTNNRWVSSIHRVVNPQREHAPGSRRLSLVFFHEPNPDAIIRCLPGCADKGNPALYPEIVAATHRRMKVAALRAKAPASTAEIPSKMRDQAVNGF